MLRKLSQAKSILASYERIRDQALDPNTSPELANTKADLEDILDDLADLDDLNDSVTAVESEPSRYGLSVEEVRRRRGFVDQIKDQVEDLRFTSAKAYRTLRVLVLCVAWTLISSLLQKTLCIPI